jgi:pimeloyl-ACP methyl ester carboxylesterase
MRVRRDGVSLHVEVSGTGDATPVLLIHGWPDTHRLWRHQVAALVDAGFRTVAPDLRGFGGSDPPATVADASLAHHVADLLGVLDHLGIDRAHVIGHDWGAALAWALAILVPERVDHLVAVSVGHPCAFARAGLAQREKSWYMLLFQFEGVAERWLAADGFANFRAWSAHPEADEVATRLADPAALTASLAIYRANVAPAQLFGPPPDLPPLGVPTMGVWSSGDFALTEEQMTGSAAYVEAPWRYERIDGTGHWVPLEAPGRLTELVLDFLPRP